jgi:hypothetical protein
MGWIEVARDTNRVAGACKCGDEPSGSIKCGEFLDWLRDSYLLKDCTAWRQSISYALCVTVGNDVRRKR